MVKGEVVTTAVVAVAAGWSLLQKWRLRWQQQYGLQQRQYRSDSDGDVIVHAGQWGKGGKMRDSTAPKNSACSVHLEMHQHIAEELRGCTLQHSRQRRLDKGAGAQDQLGQGDESRSDLHASWDGKGKEGGRGGGQKAANMST